MPLNVTLTDEEINSLSVPQGMQQKVVQAGNVVFIQVNLSTRITIGLAILTAIAADDGLWAVFGNKSEKDILQGITSIAFRFPTSAVTVESYENSSPHVGIMPQDEVTYLPVARLWRNYATGPTTVILDIGTEL